MTDAPDIKGEMIIDVIDVRRVYRLSRGRAECQLEVALPCPLDHPAAIHALIDKAIVPALLDRLAAYFAILAEWDAPVKAKP